MASIGVGRRQLRPWRLILVVVVLLVTSAVAQVARGPIPAGAGTAATPSPAASAPGA